MTTAAPAALRLRAMSFGEILDEVFRLYRRNFLLFAVLSLGLSLPVLVLQVAAGQADQLGVMGNVFGALASQAASPAPMPPEPHWSAIVASVGATVILLPLTMGVIPRAGLDAAFGLPTGFWPAVRGALQRYLALFALFFLFLGAALPIVTCLLIPLSVWILVRWSIAVPALLAEQAGPIQAMSRSWRLTKGSWWRVAGVVLVFSVLQYVAATIVSAISLPVALLPLPQTARGLLSVSVSTIGSALTAPLFSPVFVVLYLDLRVRRESIDLYQLADQAALAASRP